MPLNVNFWKLIRSLKVEPFLFLYMFTYSLSSLSISQLSQDKLCRFKYHNNASFCLQINRPDSEEWRKNDKMVNEIIKDNTYLSLYRMMLSTIPSIIWALFGGAWSDNYIQGRKILMCFGCLGALLESLVLIINAAYFTADVYLILLAFIPSALSGGIISTLMACYAYCSATSDKNTRQIRFAILEVSFWIPQPMGTFVGGQILGNGDDSSDSQLYNYIAVFIVSISAQFIALLWVLLVINEKKSGALLDVTIEQRGVFEASSASTASTSTLDTMSDVTYTPSVSRMRFNKFVVNVKHLFDLNNVKEILRTLVKSRDNKVREQLWLLFLSISCVLLSYLAGMIILWSYVERLYHWQAKYYSNINSIVSIFTMITMAIVVYVLVIRMKIRDSFLGIIGIVSLFAQCVIRGSWQKPTGLYLSFFVGALAPVTPIAIRSRLSKIVSVDEQGKVFSLMAIVESITPTLASLFYTSIFGATIDTYAGLAFQIAAFLLFIPLGVMIWIDFLDRRNEGSELEVES